MQKYDLYRKVLCSWDKFGKETFIAETWYYISDYIGEGPTYIVGRIDSNGKFLDENKIHQDCIIGYLE